MMSSASKPGSASTVIPNALRTSLVMSIWPRNSSGVALRVGLVLREPLGAEGLPGHVERGGDMGGRLVAQQVDQHRGEARRPRWWSKSVLGLEVLRGQCVERPEGQRIAVQQHQCRLCQSSVWSCPSTDYPRPPWRRRRIVSVLRQTGVGWSSCPASPETCPAIDGWWAQRRFRVPLSPRRQMPACARYVFRRGRNNCQPQLQEH